MPSLQERQLTFDETNHVLTNIGVWSLDGKWIDYDIRSEAAGSVFDGNRIERVNVETGKKETLYCSTRGANVGVVTASPKEGLVAFIEGPQNPSNDWQYSAWHRQGILLKLTQNSFVSPRTSNLDARNLVAPYTPGALRGGSHVHVFSGDGQWVSFTYEDHVLATSLNPGAQRNQRNVGLSVPLGPVIVPKTNPRNHDGEYFSVLVTRTDDLPAPDSDQISRAYEDAWVGTDGYMRADGSRQKRAIAFIGDCSIRDVNRDGIRNVPELFVVDIPDDVTRSDVEPLQGTQDIRPAPPLGTKQRRLTSTGHRKYPGLSSPRHWPRSSPDGSMIAFLMLDDNAVVQLWTISPLGTELRQLTNTSSSVASAFSFRCDAKAIACVIGAEVCEVEIPSGRVTQRTQRQTGMERLGSPRPEACVYSLDGKQIAFSRTVSKAETSFNQIFVVGTTLA